MRHILCVLFYSISPASAIVGHNKSQTIRRYRYHLSHWGKVGIILLQRHTYLCLTVCLGYTAEATALDFGACSLPLRDDLAEDLHNDERNPMQVSNPASTRHLPSWKCCLYTLCAFVFALCDQRTKTTYLLGETSLAFRCLWAVPVALMVLSHYKRDELAKGRLYYLIWLLVGAIIGFLYGAQAGYETPLLRVVLIACAICIGWAVIATVSSILANRKLPSLHLGLGAIWLVMLLLMIFSHSQYAWPLWYLIVFGCLYLTQWSKEEQSELLQGIANGIVIAFLAFSAYCCIFRPYDEVRYLGIYNNSNSNALFYVIALAAIYVKLLTYTKEHAALPLRILAWLGAGAVYALLFLTMGRTGWMVSVLLGLAFLLVYIRMVERKCFFRRGLLLVASFCVMLPICFTLVRYLPPLFHHPVWFYAEYKEEKVHSWDPWDSEKYVDADDVLEAVLGRFVALGNGSEEEIVEEEGAIAENETIAESEATAVSEAVTETEAAAETAAAESAENETTTDIVAGADDAAAPSTPAPLLTDTEGEQPFLVRATIYKTFLSNLTLTGSKTADQGFYLLSNYYVYHAHNIYLQYATDFGIPVGILFIAVNLWCAIRLVKKALREDLLRNIGFLFFQQIPLLFGLLEYSWGSGSLSILLLFVSLGMAMRSHT